MPVDTRYGKASNRQNMASRRVRLADGVTLATPDGTTQNFRRIDSKFVVTPPNCEVAGLVEDSYNSELCAYIKNATGGSLSAGTLLANGTTLTAAGSAIGPAATSAGASVTLTLSAISGTIEVGSLCQFTDSVSPNDVQYSICTAVSGSDRTFDEIKYDMTSPTIVVIPALIPTAATNASGGEACWIVAATIANNGYAYVYGSALIGGLDTSGYSAVGSKVYLGTGGAATPTIPTSATTTGQRVGVVVVKSASVGQIKFYPIRRMIERFSSSAGPSLTSAHLFVGNGSNIPTDVAASGDLTLANTGAFTIANLAVTNAKIAAATIDLTAKVTGNLPVANGGTGVTSSTGSGANALATSPTLVTPILGTPTSGNLSNCTGVSLTAGVSGTLPAGNGGTGITSLGTGIATFLGTPSSANLRGAITDETGTGVAVFNNAPTLIAPVLGTIASGVGTALTALDASNISTGTVAPARLGSGSGGSTKFLREDSTFQTVSPTTGTTISKTANYTVIAGDAGNVILCDATSGTFTISLTAAATLGAGFRVKILKTTSANTVVVDANSAETINGALTNVLSLQYSYVDLICDGTNWVVLGAMDWIGVAQTSATSFPTSGQYGDALSFSLPSGEWDITAIGEITEVGGSITTSYSLGIGTVSGNTGPGSEGYKNISAGGSGINTTLSLPSYRVNLTSTAVYYEKVFATYSVATPKYYATFSARRFC